MSGIVEDIDGRYIELDNGMVFELPNSRHGVDIGERVSVHAKTRGGSFFSIGLRSRHSSFVFGRPVHHWSEYRLIYGDREVRVKRVR